MMLPQTPAEMPKRTIHINPNFANSRALAAAAGAAAPTTTHINPNFLPKSNTAIHLNPHFLQKKLLEQQQQQQNAMMQQLRLQQQHIELQSSVIKALACKPPPPPPPPLPAQPLPQQPPPPAMPPPASLSTIITCLRQLPAAAPTSCKLIAKSRMRLVREPLMKVNAVPTTVANTQLIKLGSRKLLRRTLINGVVTAPTAVTKPKVLQSKPTAPIGPAAKYKIDRRHIARSLTRSSPLVKLKRRAFVGRFALRRNSDSGAAASRRFNLSSSSTAARKSTMTASKNLQLLNINGVLYKSTRNKLQRKDSCQLRSTATASPKSATPLRSSSASSSAGRTLFVRGTRFVLDKQGFKLTRVSDATNALSSSSAASLRRIDIGGLTYVASAASHNVFVRTRHHLARTHVTQARQRSLQLLARNNLAKSNVPCAIYQRVGKCAAHLRGKCRKVHDSRQVFICARFLRGDCNNPKCLLSHQVSLAKMPVCKFYLEGICVRDDCPYLHKKVSRNTAICADFLRGYCALADKCAQRHEFLCPDYERSGKCVRVACEYCKRKTQVQRVVKLQQQEAAVKAAPAPTPVTAADQRYFISEQLKDDKKQATPAANDTAAANDDDDDAATDMAVDDDSDTAELESPTVATSRPKRAALGILPAYIPLS